MKHFMLPLLIAALASFFANAAAPTVELPRQVTDVSDGSLFWCQNSDIADKSCSIVTISDNARYALVKILGGTGCPDPQYGVINLTNGKAKIMMYNDNQTCHGEAVADFARSPDDNTLTVILYDPTNRKNVGVNPINY